MEHLDESRRQRLKRIKGYRDSEHWVRLRHQELDEELTAIQARLEREEKLYQFEVGEPAPTTIELESLKSTEADPPEDDDDGAFSGMSWLEGITAVLEEDGSLHVREIWRRLQEGGFRTNSRDPVRSIVATAVRSKATIVKVGANRYGLRGQEDSASAVNEDQGVPDEDQSSA
jgi:hypothetical protein